MWLRRLAWAAALTAALLFQITNENYLGRFLLALCVALPLLSLALSLMMVFSMGAFATMHGGVIEGGANQVVPAPEEPVTEM